MNKIISSGVLIQNVIRLDEASYFNWVGNYAMAGGLEAIAKEELGDAFDDVVKARITAVETTGEMAFEHLCDRLRAKGYLIINDEDPDIEAIRGWLEAKE